MWYNGLMFSPCHKDTALRKAFTMLELIFVIVVVAILSITFMGRFDDDRLREAADHVLSQIRYTQHLAMVDDVYDPTDQDWSAERWQIRFQKCNGVDNQFYFIFKDINHGGAANKVESAQNPLDGRFMFNDGTCVAQEDESRDVLIGNKYEITGVTVCGDTANRYLLFDNLGRPYRHTAAGTPSSAYDGYLTNDCDINLTTSKGETIIIRVAAETGFAYIASIAP